ncbi:MAG: GMP synthase, partial [Thermoplasmata archaeon]
MRIPVLDNGGQWTHREWRVLRDLGVETEILPNTASVSELRADGVVLSGGALSLEGTDALGRVGEWIDSLDVPVLAICVGHQYLGRHFGGRVVRSSPEFGSVDLE